MQKLEVLEAERLVGEGRDIQTEGPDAQLQHHRLLVAGEVAHVLEYEVLGPVVLAVGQVGRHEAVLELRVLAVVEPVHAGEALAGRPAAQQVHLAPQGDHLLALVGLHAVDCVGQQQVAVFTEHGAVGVAQRHLEGVGCLAVVPLHVVALPVVLWDPESGYSLKGADDSEIFCQSLLNRRLSPQSAQGDSVPSNPTAASTDP